MKKILIAAIVSLALVGAGIFAADQFYLLGETNAEENKTIFVAIDDHSIKTLGPMPINRVTYARVAQRARAAGAKAVVLKFFLDREDPEDEKLSSAMKDIPVVLQTSSSIDGNQPRSNSSAQLDRYARPEWMLDGIKTPLTGTTLTSPAQTLLLHTNALGTVDARIATDHNRIESFGIYQGHTIPSLQILTSEAALDTHGKIRSKLLNLGARDFQLDEEGRVSCPYLKMGKPKFWSIDDYLDGTLPDSNIKNKVVIVGYMRSDTPKIRINNFVKMPVHEYFYRQVLCLVKAPS